MLAILTGVVGTDFLLANAGAGAGAGADAESGA
jgi:hypothetical protein